MRSKLCRILPHPAQPFPVGEQVLHLIIQPPGRRILFEQHPAATGRFQRARIFLLVVLRHKRRRHKQRRPAEHAQLAERGCACAAYNQIGRRHAVCHIIDIFRHLNVGMRSKVCSLLGCHFGQPFACRRTGRMDMVIRHAVFALERQRARHVLIHIFCAHRAPEGDDKLVILSQPEFGARLFPVRREDLAAHGRTGQHDLVPAAQNVLGLLEADQHTVRLFRQHLGHLAGQCVDLEQHGGNPHLLRRAHNRK